MTKYLSDVLLLLGCALLIAGAGLLYLPLAFIVAGSECVILSWIFGLNETRKRTKGN